MEKIVLHEYQERAWTCKKRFIFFVAGVQSGKTTFGSVWIINEADQCGPGDYIILAPTYKILQQSTLQKFVEIAPRGWGTLNKADMTYRTKTGQTFFLRSADTPESIEGITAKAIWADEASLMKADAWLMMQGRVSRTGGRILLTCTPIALNWLFREIEKDKQRRAEGYDSDIEFINFRSIDSPYFPKAEYERAKRMLSETQFALRYQGIFGKAEGLIYPDFCDNLNLVDDFEIPNDWRRVGGIDWGFNNPFVGLKGAVNGDDVLFIYAERYKSQCTLEQHAPFLGTDIMYEADPSGAQEIAELRRLGVSIHEANNDVDIGILKMTARIRTGRYKVFRSCVNHINEFGLYRHEPGKEKPLKVDDHSMDAARYMVMGLEIPEPQFYVF